MAIKNLASGTLAESVSASATTLLVYVGNGSASTIKGVWPTPPFYATIMPSNPTAGVPNSLDSEIVKVTTVGNDQVGNTALTVVRGQKGSTTQAFAEGAIVTNADYVEEAVLLGDEGTAETPAPWIDSDDIVDEAVTAEKIDFSTLVPGALVTDYGQITSTTTITPSVDGYLVGKAVIFKTQANASGSCYITSSSGAFLAGIPYADVAKGQYDANLQIAWCIQVAAGETYTFTVGGDGKFDSVGLRSMSTS